jgi:mannose-6-phosphate isomerase-like protein (cupin superfamily)
MPDFVKARLAKQALWRAGGKVTSRWNHLSGGHRMKTYVTTDRDTPTWICGHWNGSPVEIGAGLRTEVGKEERHHHPYHEYYVMLEGTAEIQVEGERVALCPGMVLMVEPMEMHRVVAIGETGARWIVIKEQSQPGTKYVS